MKREKMNKEQKIMLLRLAVIIYGIAIIFTVITISFFINIGLWVIPLVIGIYLVICGCRGKSIDADLFEYYKKYGTD